MRTKNLDMIVLNNPGEPGAGFASETNKVSIFAPRKKAIKLPLMTKSEVASKILEEIVKLVKKQKLEVKTILPNKSVLIFFKKSKRMQKTF